MPPEDIRLVAHPPERSRRSTTLLSPGCCCCCCCCVHSLGSVAGALFGMSGGHRPPTAGLSAEDAQREKTERQAADRYAIKLYWLALLIVAIVTTIVTCLENTSSSDNGFLISLLIIGICLPIGQLGASVLALIYINVFPPARKPECLRRLGRMTLYSFIWGLIGTAVTWLILIGMK